MAGAGLVAALAVLVLGGCGDRGAGSWRPPERLLAEAPDETFDPALLLAERAVWTLDLTDPGEVERWRRADGGQLAAGPGGLTLPAVEEGVALVRDGDPGGSCDAVAVDTNPLRRGALALALGGGSPAFDAAGHELLTGPSRSRFRFETPAGAAAGAPAVRLVDGRVVTVARLACLRRSDDPAGLAAVAAGRFRVDLEGEVRFAVPVLPGAPAELPAAVPEGGVLRFGYGVAAGQPAAVAFAVAVRPERGGEPQELFRREAVAPGRWHDAEVDLRRFAGRPVTVQLSTHAAGAFDPRGGLPFFAHPAVSERAAARRRAPPNVVLISVDTLRADRLELYGAKRRTMPRLTAWARRHAVVFERAVVQAPWTLPSHVSMLSGVDPLVHGVNLYEPAPESLELLAEILYRRGWETLAVTGGAYLDPQFGLGQGFERYRSFRGEEHELELDGGLETAIGWVRRSAAVEAPFFLFLHTYDVHEPYLPRAPWFERFSGGLGGYPPVGTRGIAAGRERSFQGHRELVFADPADAEGGAEPVPRLAWAAYDSGIAHADESLDRLLGLLEELGIADHTAVVFTSDHGEALGDHGLAGHGYLYDHNTLVPLIVRLPGGEGAGTRIARQVRSIDVVPTLLEALGLPVPDAIDGRSLLPLVRGDGPPPPPEAWTYNAIANQGLALRHADGYKYVLVDPAWKPTAAPAEALYDLLEDPRERRPAAAPSPRLAGLRRAAQQRLRDHATGIHVQVDNPGGRELCAVLHGALLRTNSVKVPGPQSFAEWGGRGEVELRVPAGERTRLIVLGARGAPVSFRLEPAACGPAFEPLAIEASAAELAAGRGFRLAGDRWLPSPAGPGGSAAAISVAWVGPVAEGDAPAEPPSPELERRLRALGYL